MVPVPPLLVIVAEPVVPPLQAMFVCEDTEDVIAVGCVMVKFLVMLQEFASVMVQVYVPAASPVAVAAVPPDGAQE